MRKFLLLLALLFAVPQNSFAQSITGNSGTVALAPISGINGFANTLTPFVTGFGYSACSGATGVGNTCIGSNAGSSLTTGTYNTIIGQGSVGTTATPTGGYVTNVGATNLPVITSASEV